MTRAPGAKMRYCSRKLATVISGCWRKVGRTRFPEERVYTFWDYFRQHWERNSGLRIDHLLLNQVLRPRLVEAGVDRWVRGQPGASDHAPTWVRLQTDLQNQ